MTSSVEDPQQRDEVGSSEASGEVENEAEATSEWPAPGADAPIEGSGGQTPPAGYDGEGVEGPGSD